MSKAIEHDCKKDPENNPGWCAIELPLYFKRGAWWIGNGEYESQIFYCPFCGVKLEADESQRPEKGK